MRSELHANNPSLHSTPRTEALARVQRRYACLSEDRTPKKKGFGGLRIFKRTKHNPPTRSSFPKSVPYRTTFSGKAIEAIVGASAVGSAISSVTPNNQTEPCRQPELQPSNKYNRYSRPTAFALIPELQISREDDQPISSDYNPSTRTNASNDLHVSSHMLSEKLSASRANREGALFIMASLRQTLGVSK